MKWAKNKKNKRQKTSSHHSSKGHYLSRGQLSAVGARTAWPAGVLGSPTYLSCAQTGVDLRGGAGKGHNLGAVHFIIPMVGGSTLSLEL